MATVELPPFSSEQKEISDLFVARLRSEIEQLGAISFSDYMHRSLYENELGYYVNGFSKLGAHGDFVTAPEISNDFAACLATQCQQVFSALDERELPVELLELGGGSGRLAADLLLTLNENNKLPVRYLMLDVSPDLQHQQQQVLKAELPAAVFQRVQWLNSLPEKFNGVVIANEVLDAFAVERFKMVSGVAERLMVNYTESGFTFESVADDKIQAEVAAIMSDVKTVFSDDYQSEYCPLLVPWWQSVSSMLEAGAVLVCDYGSERRRYYSPTASDGTLRCFFRHAVHDDPFARPAVQDITADVDFTAVTIAATEVGLELQGYTPLSQFMLSLGVLERLEEKIKLLDERGQIAATGDLKRVILPQEMGDRFMVIGFSKSLDIALSGFSRADWSRLL